MALGDPPGERPRDATQPLDESMCWNFMTPAQQWEIGSTGSVWTYGGGSCDKPAEVAVIIGVWPGPRFYCRSCAAEAVE